MTSTIGRGKIVSTLAFALGHDPTRFGLELDNARWACLEVLFIALRFDRYDWAHVDDALLNTVVEETARFEIRDGRTEQPQLRRPSSLSNLDEPRMNDRSADT